MQDMRQKAKIVMEKKVGMRCDRDPIRRKKWGILEHRETGREKEKRRKIAFLRKGWRRNNYKLNIGILFKLFIYLFIFLLIGLGKF